MPAHHFAPGRRTPHSTAAVLVCLLTLLALLAVLPGSAHAAPARDGKQPTHPERDWMGSTLRHHEGEKAVPPTAGVSSVDGVDVSSHNGNVSWSTLWNSGNRFAYTKATEGTSYTNPYFAQQYNGAYKAGMIRGAYHFALPGNSGGAAQANYFVNHGGGWSSDGRTLPGVLDMEYNPYGSTCYDMSAGELVDWVADFFATYRSRTGRDAVIYTSTTWWKKCTGNYAGFGRYNPLWVPSYGSSSGELPAGWDFYTFWQYTDTGPVVGDHNRFNGSSARLKALAYG
ncbi:lysozyme [Streptomyces cinnamoneus]|uniref:lysozyme n=1 Tax=Streptomyces cinnamoneus TaxID=53446 RepID=A0A2G1XDD5_STRCJ|nr:lysozyme [Streptomyces cinnamoneus]PHQ49242.1 lysozyme [Streptomyces cinnamoneus]PPT15106.1 lysozyme [Streptomyces cinnamoneus]